MNNFDAINEKLKEIYRKRGIKNILFVCLGNLCRSPMADYLFRDRLNKNCDRNIKISSGGFLDLTGAHAPEEIQCVMEEAGVDISSHRSTPINKERIKKSDLIIVMETGQKEKLSELYPESAYRLFLLSQFDRDNPEERNIADPMGGTMLSYKTCFSEIDQFVDGLVDHILSLPFPEGATEQGK